MKTLDLIKLKKKKNLQIKETFLLFQDYTRFTPKQPIVGLCQMSSSESDCVDLLGRHLPLSSAPSHGVLGVFCFIRVLLRK